MSEAWIVSAVRTPMGRFLGALKDVPAPELAAVALREALRRTGLPPGSVDEVVIGNVVQAGVGQAPARQAALRAGLPETVAAVTVNKVCGSGLKAAMLAAQAIRCGDAKVVVAGGMESMSRAPHLARSVREGTKFGDVVLTDSLQSDGLWCAFDDRPMGKHAEATAAQEGITRQDQDRYACESQRRAAEAVVGGAFRDEIVPVAVRRGRDEVLVENDEGPRPDTTVEGLARLKPAFDPLGTVTAGNSSLLSDGAAALVVVDRPTANALAVPWKARIVGSFTFGTAPKDLFVAPVGAVRGVLDRCGLRPDDIDLFEINEAFAAQMLACLGRLDLDPARVNVHGGAIALGHPIGASGARVLTTLLWALHRTGRKRGLCSLCLGGGNAVAMIVERD